MAKTHFLNVDLDLHSDKPLRPIAKELGDRIFVLRSQAKTGMHLLSFEFAGETPNPDRTIASLCGLVDSLGEKGRQAWDRSSARVFDIGYSSGGPSPSYTSVIKSRTLQRVARLGGAIAITIYPDGQELSDGKDPQ